MANEDFIMLKRVRVSYPHLFTQPIINGDEGKCGGVLMLHKDDDTAKIDLCREAIDEVRKDKLKGTKLPAAKIALRDGDESDKPEYEGHMTLSANHKKRPLVIASNGRDVVSSEEDNQIYAGCYVNVKIRFWAQNNNYGKRVNAELVAIQFADDGEPLDGSYVSVEDAMDGFGGGEIDDDDDFLSAA